MYCIRRGIYNYLLPTNIINVFVETNGVELFQTSMSARVLLVRMVAHVRTNLPDSPASVFLATTV